MTSPFQVLEAELGALEAASLLREPNDLQVRLRVKAAAAAKGVPFIDASSNDYLGFAREHVSRETVFSGEELGAGASRLVHGSRASHVELERELAAWVDQPSALLFSSGYAANVGLISALSMPDTLLISDQLNHASIVDGCRLGRGTVCVVPHRDIAEVERTLVAHANATAKWVITESYFSMDGDTPDLPALTELCTRFNAGLILDEAHALGVFGPEGAGLAKARGVRPAAIVGPLGKAPGLAGAFVAGPEILRRWLWNRARSFVFSTGTSPLQAALACARIRDVRSATVRRDRLARTVTEVRSALEKVNVPILPNSHGPILPLLTQSADRALRLAQRLQAQGILAQAIRPPSVPAGSSRIRLTLSAALTDSEVKRLVEVITRAWEQVRCT